MLNHVWLMNVRLSEIRARLRINKYDFSWRTSVYQIPPAASIPASDVQTAFLCLLAVQQIVHHECDTSVDPDALVYVWRCSCTSRGESTTDEIKNKKVRVKVSHVAVACNTSLCYTSRWLLSASSIIDRPRSIACSYFCCGCYTTATEYFAITFHHYT